MDKEMHRKGDGKRVASDNGRDRAAGGEASGRTVTVPSEMAQNLRVAEDGDITRYDASARNLVAEKPVLAYILKSALDEYAGYTPQEIAERFIEGESEVRTMAVHQDHPDRPQDVEREAEEAGGTREAESGAAADEAQEVAALCTKRKAEHELAAVSKARDAAASGTEESGSPSSGDAASGMMSGDDKVIRLPTADKSQRDGTIFYDIYFRAILPSSGGLADIYVNIEIQNNDTPGYPITKRGIYYASRMISSQRGRDFKDQGYGEIKKVVSIWLCEDVAESRSGTINSYSIEERCLLGNYHEERRNYDLMSIVVMRLGKRGEESRDDAIRLLSRMFSKRMGYGAKLEMLQNEFKISVTKEIDEEGFDVCSLGEGVYNRGFDKGYDSGFDSGAMRQKLETSYNLQRMGLAVEQISEAVEVSADTVRQWLAERDGQLVKR